MRLHALTEVQGSCYIVVVITQRNIDGFPNSLQTGKMNDGIYGRFVKHPVQRLHIQQVDLMKPYRPAGDLLNTMYGFLFAVYKVVCDNHLEPRVQEFNACVAADVSGAAGYQDVFCLGVQFMVFEPRRREGREEGFWFFPDREGILSGKENAFGGGASGDAFAKLENLAYLAS